MQSADVNGFFISTGPFHGRIHVFITHKHTGRQWVSKNENADGVALLASSVTLGVVQFFPDRGINSCDGRFFQPLNLIPKHEINQEFDSLCFTE